jgi:predicted TIM-barrel fold metal-dependent hydrolase
MDSTVQNGEGRFRLDWMISVDDHVLEPPNVWQDRVPAKYKDAAPRVMHKDGEEFWQFEGRKYPTSGLSAVAGKKYDEITPHALSYDDMRPGCYDPKARLVDMDEAGVIASLNFPSFPRFAGQAFMEADDSDLGLLCIQAWNDWMLDEWCGTAPGRYIPGTLVPFWDVAASVREIERCVAKGSKGVIFSENPAKLKYKGESMKSIHSPDRHWDPLWAVLQETGLPLCMHYGSSSTMAQTAPDAPYLVSLAANSFILPISTTLDWIFSGNLGRFPRLKVCMSESQIGWVAPTLERAEYVLKVQGEWNRKLTYSGTMSMNGADRKIVEREEELFVDERSPTQIFKDQIYACFFNDFVGIKAVKDLDAIDNVMIEMDYPHTDSTWPNSLRLALEQVAGLTDEEKWKVLAGNAMRIHDFQPAYPAAAPVGASSTT